MVPSHADSEASPVDVTVELRGAALFKLIWDNVVDVLGTAATAALVRRAAQRAMPRSPELGDFAIVRTDAGYTYALPRALIGKLEQPPRALRELLGELRPLLAELTGKILIRRLEQIPGLQERGLIAP
jgi:hypothetical protein